MVHQWEQIKATLSKDLLPLTETVVDENENRVEETVDSTATVVGTPHVSRTRSMQNSSVDQDNMKVDPPSSERSNSTVFETEHPPLKGTEASPTKKAASSAATLLHTSQPSRATSVTPRTLRSSVSARNTPTPSEISVALKTHVVKPRRGRRRGSALNVVASREGTVVSSVLDSQRSSPSAGPSETEEGSDHEKAEVGIGTRLRLRHQLTRPPRFDDYVPHKRIKTSHAHAITC
jgi:hypothetical protein